MELLREKERKGNFFTIFSIATEEIYIYRNLGNDCDASTVSRQLFPTTISPLKAGWQGNIAAKDPVPRSVSHATPIVEEEFCIRRDLSRHVTRLTIAIDELARLAGVKQPPIGSCILAPVIGSNLPAIISMK